MSHAKLGIQINAFCPGVFRTSLAGESRDSDCQAFVDRISGFAPIDREEEPEEIRGPALFLASAA